MMIEAGALRLLPVLFLSVSGHGDEEYLVAVGIAEGAGGVVAVEAREPDIEEDNFGLEGSCSGDG